jgi:addiction module HigA family antidote
MKTNSSTPTNGRSERLAAVGPPNPHPGETILEDFLKPYRMTPYRLAKGMGVPPSRVLDVLKGRRGITADTALRLSRFLGGTPEFWMGLQAAHDLRAARRQLSAQLEALTPYQHEGPIWLDGEPCPQQKTLSELETERAAALLEAGRPAKDAGRAA